MLGETSASIGCGSSRRGALASSSGVLRVLQRAWGRWGGGAVVDPRESGTLRFIALLVKRRDCGV